MVLSCSGGTPGTPFPVTFDAFLNVPVINPGASTLTDGVNIYSGALRAGTNNDIVFQNVSFNPPGISGSFFTIGNIFVNPSLTPGGIFLPASFYEITETISDSAFIPIANSQGVVAFTNPSTLTSFTGGSSSAPAALPAATLVGAITGSIGGLGSQDYYSFFWPGGSFSATASLTGAPNPTSSYLFSEGVTSACNGVASLTLNNGDSFTGTITNANLAAGQYCIGIDANNPTDPNFTLTFNTPVTSQAPEPTGLVLFSIGAGMLAALRLKARPR